MGRKSIPSFDDMIKLEYSLYCPCEKVLTSSKLTILWPRRPSVHLLMGGVNWLSVRCAVCSVTVWRRLTLTSTPPRSTLSPRSPKDSVENLSKQSPRSGFRYASHSCSSLGPFHGAIAVPLSRVVVVVVVVVVVEIDAQAACDCTGSDTGWMGVRQLAVANGPNIFQMLLV